MMSIISHRKKVLRRICFGLLASTALYVAAYIPNSLLGGYWMEYAFDFRGGPTMFYWQPAIGFRAPWYRRTTVLGYAFAPLIEIDRRIFHPTIELGSVEGNLRFYRLTVNEVHPHWRTWYKSHLSPTGEFELRDTDHANNEIGSIQQQAEVEDGAMPEAEEESVVEP